MLFEGRFNYNNENDFQSLLPWKMIFKDCHNENREGTVKPLTYLTFCVFLEFLPCHFFSTCRTNLIQSALRFPELRQPFKYTERCCTTNKKCFRASQSQWTDSKLGWEWVDSKRFKRSETSFPTNPYRRAFCRAIFFSTRRTNLIQSALCFPERRQSFKYEERCCTTNEKCFRTSQNQCTHSKLGWEGVDSVEWGLSEFRETQRTLN